MAAVGKTQTANATKLGFWVFLCALLPRLAMAYWGASHVPPTADGAFYHVVAQRIAAGLGYTWLWPDGTVTYAAHYPVGYPAMMALPYRLLGARPVWAMIENAVIGAAGVYCVFGLSARLLSSLKIPRPERWALLSSLLLAFSPTMLLYTPALMTELCVGAIFICATRLAQCWQDQEVAHRRCHLLLVGLISCLAIACYLRPQSILLAPVLGFLLFKKLSSRLIGSLVISATTLVLVLPWTQRNCSKMDSCVFVSANGGWNLLIGTFPEGQGAWVALDGDRVPEECREVYSESGKDACFGAAGKKRIGQAPFAWLSLVPSKLRATFDYSAAGSAHLIEAGTITPDTGRALTALELVYQRGLSLLALIGLSAFRPAWFEPKLWWILAVSGGLGFLGMGAWWGWLIFLILGVSHPRLRAQIAVGGALAVVGTTIAVHAIFFGAARYSVPVWYAVGPMVALGSSSVGALLRSRRTVRSGQMIRPR